jgi:hypothetical protein
VWLKSDARANSWPPQLGQSVSVSDPERVRVSSQLLHLNDPAPTKVPEVSDSMVCSSLCVAAAGREAALPSD